MANLEIRFSTPMLPWFVTFVVTLTTNLVSEFPGVILYKDYIFVCCATTGVST